MPGRVLIADDLATNRIILKVKLSAAGYDVVQAATLPDIWACTGQSPPELIILDGNFHNDRSIDICHELSENPATAPIPVVILATGFTPADRLAALHAGACDVLDKPVDDNTLLARIRNAMRLRGIEEELRLREGTAVELGFHEATTAFKHPAQVLVINGADSIEFGWQAAFKTRTPCTIHQVRQANALDAISRKNLHPDIVILPASKMAADNGLLLLAELRSHTATRHAAIVVVQDAAAQGSAISAMDMGASEVLTAATPPAEFAFRLHRQLLRKQKADRLRHTLADGLRLAVTDPLTGLFNRRYAFPHMSRIAQKSNAARSPFAVMVLDLDRFKRINDTYGHMAGDVVLKEIANRLKSNLRGVDMIARIGGEEFLVVMPDTDLKAARIAAERLRCVTQATPISIAGGRSVCTTVSIGVSIGGQRRQVVATVQAMVERADQALLAAKSTGRNQVTFEKSAA